jgi:hypothetical protein
MDGWMDGSCWRVCRGVAGKEKGAIYGPGGRTCAGADSLSDMWRQLALSREGRPEKATARTDQAAARSDWSPARLACASLTFFLFFIQYLRVKLGKPTFGRVGGHWGSWRGEKNPVVLGKPTRWGAQRAPVLFLSSREGTYADSQG